MGNGLRTTLLLAGMTGLLMMVGGLVAGRGGMMGMLVVSAIINFGTFFFADSIVLRTTRAVPAPRGELGWLHEMVEELAQRAGIPTPRLYVIPHENSPNAFATGRSPERGVVAVTAGLLRAMPPREVRGVLAHEIGHIANRDTLVSAIAATMGGVVSMLAYSASWGSVGRRRDNGILVLLVALLAPLAATVLRMAVSRSREYGADAYAAKISGDPDGLADALARLGGLVERQPMQNEAARSVHFFVHGFGGGLAGLFSTHPPIAERVQRLRARDFSDG
ncbi:MAG: M48 family metalloprotease [Deltaproteobacteria bacterium]|nr:M48 family metalloprotease [Deltaproteobacteria bacterium]